MFFCFVAAVAYICSGSRMKCLPHDMQNNSKLTTMKRTSLFAMAALVLFAATSCVDESYDLEKLDLEMTLIPGISIAVDQNLDMIGADGIFNVKGSDIKPDSNGDYNISMKKTSASLNVDGSAIQRRTVMQDARIVVPVTGVPDFLKACRTRFMLHEPKLTFAVDNPLGCDVVMNAVAKANGERVPFSVELPAGAKGYAVSVTGAEMGRLFCPIPDEIIVEEMSFDAGVATKATALDATYSFGITANADVKLEFEPGSEVEFECEINLADFGFSPDMIHINVSAFNVDASISSSIPMTFTATALANDGQSSFEIDTPIQGGAIGCPTKSDVVAKASTSVPMFGLVPVTLKVHAVNDSDHTVVLNQGQGVSITIDRFTAVSGITLTI